MNRVGIAPTVLQGKTEGPRASWLKTTREKTGMSLKDTLLFAQDIAKWKECEVIVGAEVRPTRLKVKNSDKV